MLCMEVINISTTSWKFYFLVKKTLGRGLLPRRGWDKRALLTHLVNVLRLLGCAARIKIGKVLTARSRVGLSDC